MAYDRELKAQIDSMGAGDLIHYMLANFEPADREYGAHMQTSGYFWAFERLNEMLPADNTDEIIAAANVAADAATHGF